MKLQNVLLPSPHANAPWAGGALHGALRPLHHLRNTALVLGFALCLAALGCGDGDGPTNGSSAQTSTSGQTTGVSATPSAEPSRQSPSGGDSGVPAPATRTWELRADDASWSFAQEGAGAAALEASLGVDGVRVGFRAPPVRGVAGQFRISFEGAGRPVWREPSGPAELVPGPLWSQVLQPGSAPPVATADGNDGGDGGGDGSADDGGSAGGDGSDGDGDGGSAGASAGGTDGGDGGMESGTGDDTRFFSLRWPFEDDDHGAGEVWLHVEETGRDGLRLHSEAIFPDADVALVVELGLRCSSADEAFFGLGTQVTGMNLRGRTFPLVVQEQGIGKPEGGGIAGIANHPEAAYAPMGIWHSSQGYSAIVDHDSVFEVGLCSRERDGIQESFVRSWPLAPAMVLVNGETPRQRLFEITEYTGRIQSAPPWIFSLWKSAVGGPEEMALVEETLRAEGIPASAIWSEDWIGAEPNVTGFRLSYRWSWDPETYPDLPTRVAELNARGFAVLGYFNPFIPQTVPTWEEARDRGFLIRNANGDPYLFNDPAFRRASMIDLNNPEAVDWLRGFLRRAVEEVGLSGWMADFAEWLPLDSAPFDGEDPWIAHQRYPLRWQAIHRDALEGSTARRGDRPANDWVFFARSGWASTEGGMAGTAPALWGGDQNTDWKYDDGYPTVIPIGAHAGLAGVGIFGSDIAGYASFVNDPSTKELFFRWTTLGALSPLMRTHHGSSKCENWRFDRDAPTLAHFGRWARVHSLLYPYLDERLRESMELGLPILRHPWLVSPEDAHLWEGDDYQFFLGDDLLVAPVLREGETTRNVRLPRGTWRPLFGGPSTPPGAEAIDVDAPLSEIPVFVRAGTTIPLLATEVDTFFPGAAEGDDLRRLVDHPERLLALYPDADGNLLQHIRLGYRIEASALPEEGFAAEVRVDGSAVVACSEAGEQQSCVGEGGRLVLRGAVSRIEVGDGELTLATVEAERVPPELHLAFGGDAWGELRDATEVGELAPDLPPLCPPEEESDAGSGPAEQGAADGTQE